MFPDYINCSILLHLPLAKICLSYVAEVLSFAIYLILMAMSIQSGTKPFIH